MRPRRIILVLGGLTLIGLVAGIVALAVFVAGDSKTHGESALDDCRDLAAQERLTEALARCDRAIEEDSDLVAAYVQRASVNAALGRFQEAYDDADGALKIDEESPSGYAARARARVGLGEFALAGRDLDRAEQAGTDEPIERMALAEAYRSLGRWQAAADQAAQACDSGLAMACDLSPVPSREEGFDILHQLVLTQYDVPRLTPGFSGYHTLSETRSGAGRAPGDFEEWGFQLSYGAYFFDPIAEAGLSGVYCEVWLMDDPSRAEESFDDVASYYGGPLDEETGFDEIGEDLRAYSYGGIQVDEVTPAEGGHVVIFRRGPFIGFLTTTFIGTPDEDETTDLAQTLDKKLTGE